MLGAPAGSSSYSACAIVKAIFLLFGIDRCPTPSAAMFCTLRSGWSIRALRPGTTR